MLERIEIDIKSIILELYDAENVHIDDEIFNKLVLELPPEKFADSCDISTNIALILSKTIRKDPMKIAEDIVLKVKELEYVSSVDVVRPAFINMKLNDDILIRMVADVVVNGDENMIKNLGHNEKVNVEFCSANPTGPLHIGHARGTIFGDVMARMLEKSGYSVCREYYVNDAGGQMDKLEKSIDWRIRGANGELPDGCYPGDYLQEIADRRKTRLVVLAIVELVKKRYKTNEKKKIDEPIVLIDYREISDYIQKMFVSTNDAGDDDIIIKSKEFRDILGDISRLSRDNNVISPSIIVREGYDERDTDKNNDSLDKKRRECIEDIMDGRYDFLINDFIYIGDTNIGDTNLNEKDREGRLARRKVRTAREMIATFIKPTLDKIKVRYDVFSSEQELKDRNTIENSIEHLRKMGLIYEGTIEPPKGQKMEDWEPREQMLFRATKFGDDIDRPLAKSDGSHTYFASDIAYHYDKFVRGFSNMIVVLGADHKGYVKRLTSAVRAISDGKADVHVKLCELVNFVKNGEMVKMSKRKNNFLTIDDVVDEIDPDVLRFIVLTRKADTVLNFDLSLAKEQSKDNPIWYIQYAHSRCCSVLDNAKRLNVISGGIDSVAREILADIDTLNDIRLPIEIHKLLVHVCFYTRFLELSVTSTSIGHTFRHFPQEMHLFGSHSMRTSEK